MAIEIVRRIRGNIHGSIDISALEDKVISHQIFQRLRRIQQTAFLSYVFPGATHTRFEHSLGVLHLAKVAWLKLQSNQERLAVSISKYGDFQAKEQKYYGKQNHGLLSPTFEPTEKIFSSDYVFQALRLAALLHDIGHPPFSHSGERFLPSAAKVIEENPDLPQYLVDFLKEFIKSCELKGISSDKASVSHEIFTILLIDRLLSDVYSEHNDIDLKIEARDIISIIVPEIKPSPDSELEKLKLTKLCHELVSSEFDIDRMDYLRRDSRECGVIYGIFDADRILDSLTIYWDQGDQSFHLAIQYSGLAAFEDYLRARQSMYLQLYFHKTSVAAEAMLQNLFSNLDHILLPANLEEYIEVDEFSVFQFIKRSIEENIKDDIQKNQLIGSLKDLLIKRKLWKRVFEISGTSNATKHSPDIEKAKKALDELNIPYQQLSSRSNLTNFRPRELNKESHNYLRLIKKDGHQFPRVVPIEDYTQLISESNTVNISRLYIENKPYDENTTTYKKATKTIAEKFE